MRLVSKKEKGVSVKLGPLAQDKSYYEKDPDTGETVHVVAGRVVKVDEPSVRMQMALKQRFFPDSVPTDTANFHTLLVETDEEPTPIADVDFPYSGSVLHEDPAIRKLQLESEARKLGFELTGPSVDDGETSDLATRRRNAGEVENKRPEPPKVDNQAAKDKADKEAAKAEENANKDR